ncbi:MAG: hypothetical protein K0R65_2763 [Crocinitomicaceae bacterium]|nr:hypothetical protein [Crocinitomicaceae bacterium]
MKKINQLLAFLPFTFSAFLMFAQGTEGVSISTITTPPSPNAMLDIKSNSKGMLVPRVTYSEIRGLAGSLRAATNLQADDHGLMVFVTDQDVNYGYWYFDKMDESESANGTWKQLVSTEALWKRTSTDPDNIYYGEGKVQIGTGDELTSTSLLNIKAVDNTKYAAISLFGTTGNSVSLMGDDGGSMRLNSKAHHMIFIDNENAFDDALVTYNGGAVFRILHNTSYLSTDWVGQNLLLEVYESGNMWIDGDLSQSSDSLLKKNINKLNNCSNKLKQIRGVSYKWNNKPDNNTHIGVLAQEIEQVFPDLVTTRTDPSGASVKAVNYIGLIPVLIESNKEQQEIIEEQQEEIEALKTQMQSVLNRLEALEND